MNIVFRIRYNDCLSVITYININNKTMNHFVVNNINDYKRKEG